MSLDEPQFIALADALLEHIANRIDDALGDEIDVVLQGGILTLSADDGQYVLNRHAPNREIWLSSPVSGAWHFAHSGEEWISTREPRKALPEVLSTELATTFGVTVDL